MSIFLVDYLNINDAVQTLNIEASSEEEAIKKATKELNMMGYHKRDIINVLDIWKCTMDEIIGD